MGWRAKAADIAMIPIMYLISGTFRETPQRGHRWNNLRFSRETVKDLDRSIMVHCTGKSDKVFRSRWLFLFHIPIIGGWRNYVVLAPITPVHKWHVGYITNDVIGVSRIPLSQRVRMLLGHGEVSFYGIDAQTHEQIPITQIGEGRIGGDGKFAKDLLL